MILVYSQLDINNNIFKNIFKTLEYKIVNNVDEYVTDLSLNKIAFLDNCCSDTLSKIKPCSKFIFIIQLIQQIH
jgi:hypothetical protein